MNSAGVDRPQPARGPYVTLVAHGDGDGNLWFVVAQPAHAAKHVLKDRGFRPVRDGRGAWRRDLGHGESGDYLLSAILADLDAEGCRVTYVADTPRAWEAEAGLTDHDDRLGVAILTEHYGRLGAYAQRLLAAGVHPDRVEVLCDLRGRFDCGPKPWGFDHLNAVGDQADGIRAGMPWRARAGASLRHERVIPQVGGAR